MKIVLLGYMGSGKSTIASLLSQQIDIPFRDMDDIISEKEGISIPLMFETKGEIYFRKKETEYLRDFLGSTENIIMALGGGTPCYGNNMELLQTNDTVSIYLKASIPSLIDRLKDEREQRPLISHLKSNEELAEFFGKHLFERQVFYNKADHIVTTDGKSPAQVVGEIVELIVN